MDLVNEWVSQEFQNLAQVINDYDHNLFLEFIPPERQQSLLDKKKCFRIVDDRTKTIVMYIDSLATPTDVLAKLWTIDQDKNDVVAQMDARNAATEALQMRKNIDELEAQKDFVAFVAKNQKSRWHHEGRVRDEHFNDLGPVSKVVE